MSTIGSLLALMDPGIQPYNAQELTANRIQSGNITNQTGLLQLAELQRQQEAEQAFYGALQRNPGLLLGGGGGMPQSTLGSLQGAPGAITQSPLPGMPGQTQTVPAPMDLSQFASGQPAPQSTLGGVAPPPRPDPVRDLLQQNPRAGLQLMDMQYKAQERVLGMQEKKWAYTAQLFQGATDQATWDRALEEYRRFDPQGAAQIQPTYSKPVQEQLVQRALSAKDTIANRLERDKLNVLLRGQDVDLAKLQQQGGKLNYQTDAQGNIVAVPEYANGTTLQARPVLGADGQPVKSLEAQKHTAEQEKTIRAQENALRTHVDGLLKNYYEVRDAIGRIEASADQPDSAGDLAMITTYMKLIDPSTGVRDQEFRNAENIGGFVDRLKTRLANWASGDRLVDTTRAELLERSRKLYAQYEKDYGQVKQQYRDLTTRLGGNPANVVLETGSTAAQAPRGNVKPVGEMSREELLAERDRLRKGGS